MKKLIYNIIVLAALYLFIRYILFAVVLWIIIELLYKTFKEKKCRIILDFICNFVITLSQGINYVSNILLSIPANRILINSDGCQFGDPASNFTKTLNKNILKGTVKPRGMILYNIIERITNF